MSKTCEWCNGSGTTQSGKSTCPACKGIGQEPDEPLPRPTVGPQGGSGTAPLKATTEPKGKGIAGHPFLTSELYEKCPACKGTCLTKTSMMVDGLKLPSGATVTGPLPAGIACPLCEKGYVKTGLTVGQVERFRAQLEILHKYVSLLCYAHGLRESATKALADAKLNVLPCRGERASECDGDDFRDGNAPHNG